MPIFPTLPRGARLAGPYADVDLRDAQASSVVGRLFGGALTLGDNLSLPGVTASVALIHGTWGWPKNAVLTALDDEAVTVNERTLTAGESCRLNDGDHVAFDGVAFEFIRSASKPTTDEEESLLGGDDEADAGDESRWQPSQGDDDGEHER